MIMAFHVRGLVAGAFAAGFIVGIITAGGTTSFAAPSVNGPAAMAPNLVDFGAQQPKDQCRNVRKVSTRMQRVIVTLKGVDGGTAAKAAIAAAQDRLLADLKRQGHKVVVDRKYPFTPQIALTLSAQALSALRQNSSVASVETDSLSAPQ